MKLWEKGIPTDQRIDLFTVGNDRELDIVLAKYDVLGSLAQTKMLYQVGLITENEKKDLLQALNEILTDIENHTF